MKRINVGCGQTPVPGWYNYDNSLSVRIARYPVLIKALKILGVLQKSQIKYMDFVSQSDILWANAAKHIPLSDRSVEVLYTSHMIEYLNKREVPQFLSEAYRVLAPNGIIRIASPDLKRHVEEYILGGDANTLVMRTDLAADVNTTLAGKLVYLVCGFRRRQWIYDGASLVKLLSSAGFKNCTILPAGSTRIVNPEGLDLRERESESVYVEGTR